MLLLTIDATARVFFSHAAVGRNNYEGEVLGRHAIDCRVLDECMGSRRDSPAFGKIFYRQLDSCCSKATLALAPPLALALPLAPTKAKASHAVYEQCKSINYLCEKEECLQADGGHSEEAVALSAENPPCNGIHYAYKELSRWDDTREDILLSQAEPLPRISTPISPNPNPHLNPKSNPNLHPNRRPLGVE